jgi:hypothetical protein
LGNGRDQLHQHRLDLVPGDTILTDTPSLRGAPFDIAERIEEPLDQTGFVIHRCDRYQPVSALKEAKLRNRRSR